MTLHLIGATGVEVRLIFELPAGLPNEAVAAAAVVNGVTVSAGLAANLKSVSHSVRPLTELLTLTSGHPQ